MNAADQEETRLLRIALARQRQIVESKKRDMALLEQKIRETLRHQDDVHLKLFPPVRSDRNAAYISSLMEEKNTKLTHLQNAIEAQEAKLDVSESDDSGILGDDEPLSQLKRQRATVHADLEHLRSLLSPIRVVPVEILAEIFMLSYDPVGTASLSNAALIITHVCSSWRNIALNRPDLWSSLKLGPGNFVSKPHGVIPLARLWLERSGNRPLRLILRPDDRPMDSPDPTPVDLFLQVVRLYGPHFARWQDILLDYPRFTVDEELFSGIPHDASFRCLESFGIVTSNITLTDWVNFPRLLAGAYLLRRVTWITKSFNRDPPFLYGQLTHLEVGGDYSLKRALIILTLAKRLRNVDFTVLVKRSNSATDFPPVVNESLQELHVACIGKSSVFFDTLTLPALQELHITKSYSWENSAPSTWSQGSFVQFLSRSKCHLTCLGIVDYDMTSSEVLALLRHVSPSLVEFDIESFQVRFITDDVLNALTYPIVDVPESSTILCPLLRELRIVGCLSSTDGVLAKMVGSRCRPPPGLARLEIGMFGLDSSKSPEDYEGILALNGRKIDYMILDEVLSDFRLRA